MNIDTDYRETSRRLNRALRAHLAEIREQVRNNSIGGKDPYDGLTTDEIAKYNRAMMFGDDGTGFDASAFKAMTG